MFQQGQITNDKHQISNKSQIPTTNDQNLNPEKPEAKKINHENTKGRKHENNRDDFRVFRISSFRDDEIFRESFSASFEF